MPEELRHPCLLHGPAPGGRAARQGVSQGCLHSVWDTSFVPASDERTHVPPSHAAAEHSSTVARLTKHAREPGADGVQVPRGAEVRHWAQGALQFVERTATERAGEPASARTVCLCGVAGTVAYSMIGARARRILALWACRLHRSAGQWVPRGCTLVLLVWLEPRRSVHRRVCDHAAVCCCDLACSLGAHVSCLWLKACSSRLGLLRVETGAVQ